MQKNVLVFPCGSEIGLEIHNALRFTKNITLFGGGSYESDHGKFVYKNYIANIPHFEAPAFIEMLNQIIVDYQIDYIFPALDGVILKLAEHCEELQAEVITSSLETCQVCRSKKKTYQLFMDEPFTPKMYQSREEVISFPVFLKPDIGSGSNGIVLAETKEVLDFHLERTPGLLMVEYLPGKEYTIDCFTDRNGELKFAGMRERCRVKSGISVHSISQEIHPQVLEIAQAINEKLAFHGVWFFQVKEDNQGYYKLLEIASRVAGTMSLYRNRGVNLPLLSLYDRMGYPTAIIKNDFQIEVDRAFINRFKVDIQYKKVYIDFDDTIVFKQKINPFVMMFIYQCLSKEIPVILVTKHAENIQETLQTMHINAAVFAEILHIKREEEKHQYLNLEELAIFIDDSYGERKKVKDKFNIPVFDIDALECLIDWRY